MDREKVIKAIDICLGHGKCDDCGYHIKGGYSTMDCRKPMMRDALDILKEQEAMRVLSQRECETLPSHYERKGFCPKCHQVVEWFLNRSYCGFCGQAVKWE